MTFNIHCSWADHCASMDDTIEATSEDYNSLGDNDEERMRDEFYRFGGLKFSREFSNH